MSSPSSETTAPRLLVLGNINADRVLRLDRPYRAGDDIAAIDLGLRLGGAAANAASALVLAGNDLTLVGTIGSDQTADALALELAANGLSDAFVARAPGPTPTCLILIEPDGERTILSLRQSPPVPVWPHVDLAGVAAVYVGARSAPPVDVFAAAAALEVPVLMQLRRGAPPPLPVKVLVASADVLSPQDAWSTVAAWGLGTEWVVVTRGAAGAMATDGLSVIETPAVPAEVVDTTGTGDAFAAALVHGIARRWPMAACLQLGVRWGALAVAHAGSTAPAAIAEALAPPAGAVFRS